MRLKIRLLRAATRKQKNHLLLAMVASSTYFNFSIVPVYRNRKLYQFYEDDWPSRDFDPDDDECSWQSVYRQARCEIP